MSEHIDNPYSRNHRATSSRRIKVTRLPENVVDGLYRRGTGPLAEYLARYSWLTPNRISFVGFLFGGVGASVCLLTLPLWTAGILLALGNFFDYLDGDLARKQGRTSGEGAIFDAVLDRYGDFLVIGALAYLTTALLDRYPDFLIGGLSLWTPESTLILGLAALLGSMLTPYLRAKTEAEGKRSVASICDRSMRNNILIIGLLAGQPIWTLGAIAVVSNIAAVQRLIIAVRTK